MYNFEQRNSGLYDIWIFRKRILLIRRWEFGARRTVDRVNIGGIQITHVAARTPRAEAVGSQIARAKETIMKSLVVKRSIVIESHKTSVSLEDAFWNGLKEIAGGRHSTLSGLIAAIDTERHHGNLSSAIRLFVLDHFRAHTIDDRQSQATRRPNGAGSDVSTVIRMADR